VKTNKVGIATVITMAASAFAGLVPIGTGSATGAQSCVVDETYSWTGEVRMLPWNPTFDTGLVIPGPGDGETLTVIEARYSSFDRYPADGSAGNRIDAAQMHESFGISIGGTPFGGLSTDVPNGPDEGAPDEYFSGIVTGSFGTGPTAGGSIVVRHASLYGFTESPNSVNAAGISVVVERCREVAEPETTPPTLPPTTPPTTAAAVETTPPTTEAPATTPPETTIEQTTSTAASNAPPNGVQPSVLAAVVRAPARELPATGATSASLVLAASLLALSGMGLLIARRRPSDS
jgi:LPXTG-motif cell wall-anchored protein